MGPQMGGMAGGASGGNGNAGTRYTTLDSLTSNATAYITAPSDYSTAYGSDHARGKAGAPLYDMRSSNSAIPADVGELPPGMSMGPFLRAAIKSLTGQSLGDSPYGSDGGDTAPAATPGSGGYGSPAGNTGMYHGGGGNTARSHSPGPSCHAGPTGGSGCSGRSGGSGASHHQGYGNCVHNPHPHQAAVAGGYPHSRGSPTPRQNSGPVMGADAMAAAVRASAQAAAEQEASSSCSADECNYGGGSGSVFQSLWMQRLVAAAQAQQQDEQAQHMYNMR